MKELLFIISLFFSYPVLSQNFTDVAVQQGITLIQNTSINFGNGMSFYDFDEDGWDDLTFPTNVDSIYFYRNELGSFVKVEPGLYAPGKVRQLTWLDYDNDGDLDLFCSFHDMGIRMYANDGNLQFTDVTAAAGFDTSAFEAFGVSVADPDEDGDVDIYVCVYWLASSLNPVPNQYYENQGNGTFNEKAMMLNIDNGLSSTFQSVWFDANNDSHLDLTLVNDRHDFQDELYLNDGQGNYTASATSMGIDNDGHFPMSLSISDYDNDGFQDVFKSDAANGTMWNGMPLDYKLYKNNFGNSFTNVAPSLGLNHQAFAWGGLWIDYNNDSYEDLFISTGFVDTINNPTLSSVFFQNNQGVTFHNATDSIQANLIHTSHSAVKGDINHDGFYDIVVLNDGTPSNILLNGGNANKYVRITAVGTESNRMALGSTIKVYANNTCQTQTVLAGSGLCAQNSQHMIFGVENSDFVDSVIVTFPNGNVAKRFNLPTNNDYEILEKTLVQVTIPTGLPSNDLCLGDNIQIGIPGLTNYQWSTGATTPFINVNSSGTYSFTAENQVGDSLFQSYDLVLTFHDDVPHQTIVIDADCGPGSLGYAEVSPLDPTIVDSIIWSNGTVGGSIIDVIPNTYNYWIHSIYGCVDSGFVTVGAQGQFSTQFFTTPYTDQQDGTVQFYIWGGNPPFTYVMDSNVISDYVDTLSPGSYEVIITDASGCSDTVNFVIENESTAFLDESLRDEVQITYINEQVSICVAEHTGRYDVNITNGIGQKIAEWKDYETVDCKTTNMPLDQGWYFVTVQTDVGRYTKRIYSE
ncbi:MAG: CRTAC1 family protein [bacterium]|nr:CRTAC1 family protein [bacterium]